MDTTFLRKKSKYTPRYLGGRSKEFIASFRIFEMGTMKIYSFEVDPSQQDAFAIFDDWKMVGEDLKTAMQQFEQELNKK